MIFCKVLNLPLYLHIIIIGTLLPMMTALPLIAEQAPNPKNAGTNSDKIHVTSDKLISHGKSGYFEFIGNVRAEQKDTVITTDTLRVHYKKQSENKNNPLGSIDAISKLEAIGNVKINVENGVAETDKAVYLIDKKVLVLTGPNSKFTSGNNTISGSKMTLHMDDERISVEGGQQKRVEAVYYPD